MGASCSSKSGSGVRQSQKGDSELARREASDDGSTEIPVGAGRAADGAAEAQPAGRRAAGEAAQKESEGSGSEESWQSSEDHNGGGKEADEKGGATNKDPRYRHQASSKLEDGQRRRLSVSTVQADGEGGKGGVVGLSHASLVQKAVGGSGGAAARAGEAGDSRGTAGAGPAGAPGGSNRRRSLIKKYTDPALQLVDEKRGAIREVTPQMILDLVPNAYQTLGVFGAKARDLQKGFDNKDLEIVGSMVHSRKGADRSRFVDMGIGYACKKGLKPESPNQDDFFILKIDDWSMYGVFDGHGPCGHDVSNFVHTALPFLILADPQFEEDTLATLRRAFRKVHHLLEAAAEQADSQLDCTLSGTTGTICIHRDDKLYIAHVGDSRAVVAQRAGTRSCNAIDLTQDHKPTMDGEKARIEAHGGEVRRLEGDIPFRVFVRNRMYPGLAMSRAIGDTVGAAVGVVADPDVRVVDLQREEIFLVISTDGVWEFISSQECVDFCARKSKKQVQESADFLAYESWKRWVEEEDNVVDDVTCVVVYLSGDRPNDKLLK